MSGLVLNQEDDETMEACLYCCQQLCDLIDARQLPCKKHFACKECLKPAVLENPTLRCNVCNTQYPNTKIEDLTKVKLLNKGIKREETEKDTEPLPPCDRCKSVKPEDATIYCPKCVTKICSKHQKFHDGYYGDSHESVDIMAYQQNPSSYCEVSRCPDHPEEIVKLACTVCYLPSCVQCVTSHTSNRHEQLLCVRTHTCKFRPMAEIDKSLREHYRQHLTNLNSALSTNSSRGKQICQSLDEITENCKKMEAHIKQKTEEQMSEKIKEKDFQAKYRESGPTKKLPLKTLTSLTKRFMDTNIKHIQAQSEQLIERVKKYGMTSLEDYKDRVNHHDRREEEIKSTTKQVIDFLDGADVNKLSKGKSMWDTKVNQVTQSDPPADLVRRELIIGRKRKIEIDFDDNQKTSRWYGGYVNLTANDFFNSNGESWTKL